jgi:hypothetical protein
MVKTVSIGDTHGAAAADAVLAIIETHDKFIFAGDYVDSFEFDNSTVIKNLLDIIDLKIKYPDKIILLWGNHDVHYLLGDHYSSGHRPEMHKDLNRIFLSHERLFRMSFQINDFLWTHAGINSLWFQKRFRFRSSDDKQSTISDLLNQAFISRYPPLFDVGYHRGGRYETGGPFWCDKNELRSRSIKGFNQITGHNRVKNIEILKSDDHEVILIDQLGNYGMIDESLFYYREI